MHPILWLDTSKNKPEEIVSAYKRRFFGCKDKADEQEISKTSVIAPFNPGTTFSRPTKLEDYANFEYLDQRNQNTRNSYYGLIVSTSGSTGTSKKTLLPEEALHASIDAMQKNLGLNGQWLVCLPLHYIAGTMAALRSLTAGYEPIFTSNLQQGSSFDVSDFVKAAEKMTSQSTFTALVPTQLSKLLESSSGFPAILETLKCFSTILIGGSKTPDKVQKLAKKYGLRNLTFTYGMSETCGGCVYNGYVLPGTTVMTANSDLAEEKYEDVGRIYIASSSLASGYLENDPDSPLTKKCFIEFSSPTKTYFKTDDLGTYVAENSTLTVEGRIDDVINTGGIKISAEYIRGQLNNFPEVNDSFVASVTDDYWGNKIIALVDSTKNITPEDVKSADIMPAEAVPKNIYIGKIPYLSNHKIDRYKANMLLNSLNETIKSSENNNDHWQRTDKLS